MTALTRLWSLCVTQSTGLIRSKLLSDCHNTVLNVATHWKHDLRTNPTVRMRPVFRHSAKPPSKFGVAFLPLLRRRLPGSAPRPTPRPPTQHGGTGPRRPALPPGALPPPAARPSAALFSSCHHCVQCVHKSCDQSYRLPLKLDFLEWLRSHSFRNVTEKNILSSQYLNLKILIERSLEFEENVKTHS